ncbi:MAG: phenylalanine--tRNA ligase subunit beta [Ignavibacteriota bacterium]|nr:phenylalanine--tRNA ligase subunit beta [Ignavibacteriota bacterium]
MRISTNWIKSLIPGLEIESYDDLFKRMVDIGLDIESIESEKEKYNKIVVGEVLETQKHPNADKLTLCKVNVGGSVLSIVCGAPNVEAGQKVCVARIGALIPNGGFEIKKSKIRGELSEGMICAEDELGLSDNHSGIMVLNADAVPGMEFADYTGANDYFVEIGVTPNRGDLFSQIGMAREIAGAYSLKAVLPAAPIKESDDQSKDFIKIEIESKEYCKRFTGRVVKNVTVKESPEWLQKALKAVGLRPINNIVDITNFVMMETGQPLHAFDYDKISGKKIIIRTAKEGDKFVTLDSKERVLNDKSLMVCDGEKPSAIAGIMGGEFSEISTDTKNVLIEVAYFDPVAIRKNSKKLGLQTDASQRFERGVDIDNLPYVSDRAASLMQAIASGEVLKGIADVYPEKFVPLEVPVRESRVDKILGVRISEDEIKRMLEGIEIKFVKKEEDRLYFSIPEFRREDLQREIDLIEETARLYGYSNIKSDFNFNLDVSSHIDYEDKYQKFLISIREYFIGRGFNEIISYTQQDDKKISGFGTDPVIIENPNSVLMNSMRVNLLYGMLTTMVNNVNALGKDVSLRLFELGKTFSDTEQKFTEEHHVCFALSGLDDKKSYDLKEKSYDVYDIKGELEIFLSKLNIENHELIYYNEEGGRDYFEIMIKNSSAGKLFILNKKDNPDLETENDVFVAELDTYKLFKNIKAGRKYKEISRYPSAKRDIALLVKSGIKYSDVEKVIKESGGSGLKKIDLFDVFNDKKLGEDNRSMTFSLEMSADDKTMTDEEVNKVIDKIIKNLENKLGVSLRAN